MDEQTNKKEELRDVVPQLENRFRITIWNRLIVLAKWLIFAALTGLALGLVGTAFGKGVSMASLRGRSDCLDVSMGAQTGAQQHQYGSGCHSRGA